MSKTPFYISYNPQLNEFVRIKRCTQKELSEAFKYFRKKIATPSFKVHDFVREVVKMFVENSSKYDLDESLESLFECVVEVYHVFHVESICKALNNLQDLESSLDDETRAKVTGLQTLSKIEKRIKAELVGQDEAVEQCIKCCKLLGSGMSDFMSLFFIGPTGVGKTELARLLAKEYLGSEKKLLKINCGEYVNGHEQAKLLGSPPGYVGHQEPGILEQRAEESPSWVILFDEIEKAHPKLLTLLLGLLDDGKITDGKGTELDFSKSIFCFTSNVGIKGNVGRSFMGFGGNVQDYKGALEVIEKDFKESFSPEFINRLDSIIYFNQLTREDAKKVAKIHLKKLPIKITKKLIDYIVDNSFSEEYGARNIKRFIKNNLSVKIAEAILKDGRKELYKPVFENNELISVSSIEN